jgi:hypothetical protein
MNSHKKTKKHARALEERKKELWILFKL